MVACLGKSRCRWIYLPQWAFGLVAITALLAPISSEAQQRRDPQSPARPFGLSTAGDVMKSGSDDRSSRFNSNWLPKVMEIVNEKFAEGKRFENPGAIPIDVSLMVLANEYEVRSYFIHEGAGYYNSVGIKVNGTEKLIFPDASYEGKNRVRLQRGDFVDLGKLAAGATLDLILMPNGADGGLSGQQYRLTTNPTTSADGRQHFVGYWIENSPLLLFGAEDLMWSGDDDFEDVLIVLDFGVELSLPTKYFVRTTGNDANDGKSAAKAFKTISKAASVINPGDKVYVGAGTYAETSTVYFSRSGTEARPCLFQADTAGTFTGDAGTVTITAPNSTSWTWYVNGASYLTFDGFRFEENSASRPVTYDVVNNATEDAAYWAAYNTRVWPHGFASVGGRNVAVKNCRFTNLRHGVYFADATAPTVTDSVFSDSRYAQVFLQKCSQAVVSKCSFEFPNPQFCGDAVYGIYNANSQVEVATCTFGNAGTMKGFSRDYWITEPTVRSYKWRGVYQYYSHGTGYHVNAGTNQGDSYVHHCTFRDANDWAIFTAWDIRARLEDNVVLNARHGIHAHAEELLVQNNRVEQESTTSWKALWSLGILANRWSHATNYRDAWSKANHSYQSTLTTVSAKVQSNTITNYCYGLCVASDGLELKDLTIQGNTAFTDSPAGRQWTNYCHGVLTGWNAQDVTFSDTQNIRMTNMWTGYVMGNDWITVRFKDITVADQWNGIANSLGTARFENAKVLRHKMTGCSNWWMKGFYATTSEFSGNGTEKQGHWGLYVYGTKTPRTPQPSDPSQNPNWNWWTEVDLHGQRNNTPIEIRSCRFTNNGKMTVDQVNWTQTSDAGNGLFLGFADKSTLVLSSNVVEDNGNYGVCFYDCNVELKNNAEFSSIKNNQYGLWCTGPWNSADYSETRRPAALNVSGYTCLSGNWHAIGAFDSTLTVSNCTVRKNHYVGIGAWNSYLTARGNTSSQNGDGIHGGYNLSYDLQDNTCNENRLTGVYCYVTGKMSGKTWPKATFQVRGQTCNSNQRGLTALAYEQTAAGSWINSEQGFAFRLQNVTCNSNRSHGLFLGCGTFADTQGLAITCNNNGAPNAQGVSEAAIGILLSSPKESVTLSDTLGLTASGNSHTGILVQGHEWYWDDSRQKYLLKLSPVDLTVDGYHGQANGAYNLHAAQLRHVTVQNSRVLGMLADQPQGNVTVRNSEFTGGQAGLNVQWGWYADWQDLASGKLKDSWWNQYAVVVDTYRPPLAIDVQNSQFTANTGSGFAAQWWRDWDQERTDPAPLGKRTAVTLTNCQFVNNGCRGFEVWNNHATIQNAVVTGNGLSGGLVWRGHATLTGCTFERNCFGRYDTTRKVHHFGEGEKQSWVACELTDWYDWSPAWNYTVRDCRFDQNEGAGLVVWDYGGTAALENIVADGNYSQGVEVSRCTVTASHVSTGNGRSHGQMYLSNPRVTLTDCVASNNGKNSSFAPRAEGPNQTAWGIYVHGDHATVNGRVVAVGDQTAALTNCVANGNSGHGILSWCNSAVLTGCTANDNGLVQDSATYWGHGFQVGVSADGQANSQKLVNCTATGNGALGVNAYRCFLEVEGSHFDSNHYGGLHQSTDDWCPTLGKCLVRNTTFHGNGHSGIENFSTNTDLKLVQANRNGYRTDGKRTAYAGHGVVLTDSWRGRGDDAVHLISECVFQENAGHGAYLHFQKSHTLERSILKKNGSWGYYTQGRGRVQNNLIVENTDGAYLDDLNSQGIQFWNNTVANNKTIGLYPFRGRIDLCNNIIAGGVWGVHIEGASVASSHNLVYGNSRGDYRHPTLDVVSLRGNDDLAKPPRFTNPANGDYTLAAGSPAINAGKDLGSDVSQDLVGINRPRHRVFDIGAYEFTADGGSLRILNWAEKK